MDFSDPWKRFISFVHFPSSDSNDPVEADSSTPSLPPILPHSSLFLFAHTNRFRLLIHRLVNASPFDYFVIVVICLSSIALAAEDPVNEGSFRNRILQHFDYVFTAVFTLEMLLKIVDVGFVLHEGSYCRDLWNFVDLVVVVGALWSYVIDAVSTGEKNVNVIKTLRFCRVLRVLRPLKSVNRIAPLKNVFDCVIKSIKNVFNILLIYLLFNLIFAVIGVQIFVGR